MLVKIKPLGEEFEDRFLAIKEWPEIYFTDEFKSVMTEFKFIEEIYRSSIRVKIEPKDKNKKLTHTHLPSQYVLYAVLIKEFAVALYDYMLVFQSLKDEGLKHAEINQLIVNRNASSKVLQKLSPQEQFNFFDLFGVDDSFALEAKTILTNKGTLRGDSDFFQSVILKVINVPDASNGFLGKFVYALCENKSGAYSKLENMYLKDLKFIEQTSSASKFAHSVFRFLWNYDKLEKLQETIQTNKKEENLTVEAEIGRLPSVFRASLKYLDKEELISGIKPRYFVEPVFSLNGKLIYLSTEWTCFKEERLDLVTLKKIVEHFYPNFVIDLAPDLFTLKSISSKKILIKKNGGAVQSLPKPFILLAGISGTGKSRFVKKQALFQCADESNYLLVSVRPDWHEPSDLLGYVTRIGGESYVCTPFLKFLVQAWIDAIESVEAGEIALKPLDEIVTYWACLDEMNLAPVEQYFADYLSVIESRQWVENKYKCDALINPQKLLNSPSSLDSLRKELGLELHDDIWGFFLKNGIPIPPNLMVAGTVNMDETTHGFSRKVIDRAFTIDFGDFFPTKFSTYFAPESLFKTLTFPHFSSVNEVDLKDVIADPQGALSINFLSEINQLLIGSSFEIAYRALNEMLVALVCFLPKDQKELTAVWDDFLMTKILPRIEGDAEKLQLKDGISLLSDLSAKIKKNLIVSSDQDLRPDLLRTNISGGVIDVEFRSLKKIAWMEQRLVEHSFTSFWP